MLAHLMEQHEKSHAALEGGKACLVQAHRQHLLVAQTQQRHILKLLFQMLTIKGLLHFDT